MYRWPINVQMMDPQHHQSPEEHKAKPPRGTTSQPLRRMSPEKWMCAGDTDALGCCWWECKVFLPEERCSCS